MPRMPRMGTDKNTREIRGTHEKSAAPRRTCPDSQTNRRQPSKQRTDSTSVPSVASGSKRPASLAHAERHGSPTPRQVASGLRPRRSRGVWWIRWFGPQDSFFRMDRARTSLISRCRDPGCAVRVRAFSRAPFRVRSINCCPSVVHLTTQRRRAERVNRQP
jgi:hypothetical protein